MISQIKKFLKINVSPISCHLDTNHLKLKKIFHSLFHHELSSLHYLKSISPHNAKNKIKKILTYNMEVSRYSGALAYLLHQNAISFRYIQRSNNTPLKKYYLPKMLAGELSLANALSGVIHNNKKTVVTGRLCNGIYKVSGNIPWVTGFGLFKKIILGFEDSFGIKQIAIVPFKKTNEILISKPIPLVALSSTKTVSMTLCDLAIPSDHILSELETLNITSEASDLSRQLNVCFFLVGAAFGMMDYVNHHVIDHVSHSLKEKYQGFLEKLNDYFEWMRDHYVLSENFSEFISFKIKLMKHVFACVNFATLLAGSKSIMMPSALQRMSNEIKIFSILLCRDPITLSRI